MASGMRSLMYPLQTPEPAGFLASQIGTTSASVPAVLKSVHRRTAPKTEFNGFGHAKLDVSTPNPRTRRFSRVSDRNDISVRSGGVEIGAPAHRPKDRVQWLRACEA